MSAQVKSNQRIIVALDTPSLEVVEKNLKELQDFGVLYKIGFELFTAHGWQAVELVRKYGGRVFLDLKFHDIPTTVAKAAAVVCEHDVFMFNVHALGGFKMMKEARNAVDQRSAGKKRKPLLIAVTILTSHTEEDLARELRIKEKMQDQVVHLATLAQKAGLDGIVSSAQELPVLRKEFPEDFLIVTPGIRTPGSLKNDQKRTFTPKEAVDAGADYLVIGRPITAAQKPREQVQKILQSLS